MKACLPLLFFLYVQSGWGQSGQQSASPLDSMAKSDTDMDSILFHAGDEKQKWATQMDGAEITYFITRLDSMTFGYMIHVHGNLYIDQKYIPAVQGKIGFTTKEDAEKTARLVVEKIRQGGLPPTITVEELRQIGVLPN